MQSYIVATYLLNKNGLYEDEYKTRFAKNPPNAILSTYYGLSDAAGAGDIVLKFDVVKKHINTREMKYLVRGEQLPHLPWAAKKNMNPVLRKKIQLLMTSMGESKEGLEILKKAKLTGLVSASDKEFNNHRKIIKAVLNEEY